MNDIDNYLRHRLEKIMNISMSDNKWIQVTLPISKGGLEIRRITDIALPSFLVSVFGCRNLVYHTLDVTSKQVPLSLHDKAIETWLVLNKDKFSTKICVQKNWGSNLYSSTSRKKHLQTTLLSM